MKRELLTLLGAKYQEISRDSISAAMVHPTADTQVWVLVEGQLDVYYYRKVFDDSKTQIRKVVLGNGDSDSVKKAVIAIVNQQKSQGYKNIIGIVDKDYEHLVGVSVAVDNVYETDYKDLEVSLLNESCVRNAMVSEIPTFHTDYATSLPVARYFGYMHITTDYYGKPFGVKVDHLGWSRICNDRSSLPGYELHMLSKLNKKLAQKGLGAIGEADVANVATVLNLHALPDNIICHGHALVKMLSMLSGHTNVYDEEHLSRLFADLCPSQTAMQWNLFQQIKHWQEQPENGFDILSHEESFEEILGSI